MKDHCNGLPAGASILKTNKRPPFNYWMAFGPFEYRTSLLFRSRLYLCYICQHAALSLQKLPIKVSKCLPDLQAFELIESRCNPGGQSCTFHNHFPDKSDPDIWTVRQSHLVSRDKHFRNDIQQYEEHTYPEKYKFSCHQFLQYFIL